ncbi:acetyltransferase [Pseudomonas coronafaciens pv. porri]|uniref:Acetyltransferase n=1 Tax=Pseudomonas coronafaciens pv. porri TaxID=83964 RepID=A0ABR5JGG6_9PSED|nr:MULTISPECIES: disulfide bond formation protein B [Pseudomonas syringae group]KOP51667.1 acetyltransferase [Pseudomonas coronafaciens pv. porri]KOP57244.1 acetyltransferase [Pseudomonas coronafaciens pv. porri]RMU80630.1 Disulfide bond formation protein B [Pseudomonas coronafaciens pv. porri]RMW04141.1 Disulfide bond formation protein B [Pseudomonas coronafaciens pv. porri]
MYLARSRFLFFLASLACALIIGTAVFLQQAFGLEHCVLCVVQRALFVACGLLALAAACHAPGCKGWRRYSFWLLLIALVGAGTAGAQVWLQTASADQLIPFIARLEYVLGLLSLDTCVDRLRHDAMLCAEVTWSLFGISLPEWSLLAFTGLVLLPLYPLFSEFSHWLNDQGQGAH